MEAENCNKKGINLMRMCELFVGRRKELIMKTVIDKQIVVVVVVLIEVELIVPEV